MQAQLPGSKEEMITEFESLLIKFDDKILSLAQYARNQQVTPSNTITSELNKFKLERARVKAIAIELRTMTEAQVLDLKEQYDEDYKAAYRILETASEARS